MRSSKTSLKYFLKDVKKIKPKNHKNSPKE
jgi:hypothetical protein